MQMAVTGGVAGGSAVGGGVDSERDDNGRSPVGSRDKEEGDGREGTVQRKAVGLHDTSTEGNKDEVAGGETKETHDDDAPTRSANRDSNTTNSHNSRIILSDSVALSAETAGIVEALETTVTH